MLPDAPSAPPPVAPTPAVPSLFVVALFVALLFAFPVAGGLAQLSNVPFGLWWTELFLFLAPAHLLACAYSGRPFELLRLGRPRALHLLLGLLAGLANYPLTGALEAAVREWAAKLWPEFVKKSDIAAATLGTVHGWQIAVLVLAIGLVAPLCEESMFRGLMQPAFARARGAAFAIGMTGFLFALIHFEPIGGLARWELGILFGLLAYWTGSTWTGIAAHAANNLFATALYYGTASSKEDIDPSALQLLGVAALGALLTAPVLAAVWRYARAPAKAEWSPPEPLAAPVLAWGALGGASFVALLAVGIKSGALMAAVHNAR